MGAIKSAWRIIKEHSRAYIALNVIYYGLTACAMIFVAFIPSVQEQLLGAVREGFQSGPLRPVANAYQGGHFFAAVAWTFVVNFVAGSFLTITLPSLVVPFSGIAMGIVRATLWGLLLSPANEELALGMIPHSLTLLLEGQAYILAMFAAYVQGRSFVQPRWVGAATCGQGYLAGLKLSLKIYSLVVLLLAVAAVYEAAEVIYIVPRLVGTP